ncbi:MAG TPA: WG repeat-containing protein [Candidatus Acidoferrum sp.]|jgi:hypothetical protein
MLYPVSEPISDSVEDRFGYIDGRGNVVVQPSYLACSHFCEGKAAVIDKTRKSGFIDNNARLVIPHQFETVGRFHAGFCPAGGYIDQLGQWLIQPAFLINASFLEGRAIASSDGENLGFIDFTGNFVVPPRFSRCGGFSEGLAAVCLDDRWGFIDRAGTLEIPTVFEGPTPRGFRDGIAGARIDDCWGFIDRSGSFVIKAEYEQLRSFSEGRACVKQNGKWGMIDTEGKLVVECQFDELGPLNIDMAPARLEGKAGYVSCEGRWLIEPRFDQCLSFFRDLAVVKLGRTYTYIRRDGQTVWTSHPHAQIPYPPGPLSV